MPGPRLGHDRRDPPQVARERRQRLRHRLLVPDVGEHVAPHRQATAGLGRDVETRLVHQAQQPERAQGDGLAAGVRAGDDEGRVAVADADVDRDDATAQTGMSRGEQHDLGPVGGLGAGCVHLGREGSLGGPQVEARERVEGFAQPRPVDRDECREFVEDAGDLLPLSDLRLTPRVAELDGDERLDEQRLAAARGVVDDALDPRSRLRLDRDDVPPVAERDDRLLQRVAELRPHERVEAAAQAVVRHADRGPQAAEPGRCGVEQLPDRVEASGQGATDRRQRVELVTELAQQRPALVGERCRQPRGRVERVGDRQELFRVEPAAADRAFDRWADVMRRTDAHARTVRQERTRLVGLVEPARHDDRIGRRLQRLGQASRRRERRGRRQPVADERELEKGLGARVHRPTSGRAGPTPIGGPRS